MSIDAFLKGLVNTIVNPLIGLLFTAALVYFLWGVANYIKGASNEGDRETGSKHIMWGLVGMFIMVSVYGIIEILLNTFHL